jgi:trimethylamine---corrinoid protein Co-methyltransferase
LEAVHLASLRVLEEVGVEMLDRLAIDLLAASGAEVDRGSNRVRLAPELVMKAVGSAPARFTMHSRNPIRAVEIGGDTMVLAPVGGPAMATDLERGRRPGSYEDQVNFIKLSQHARILDMSYRCVEAQDLPINTRQLDYLYAALRYSDKPLGAMALDAAGAQDSLAVAALPFGGEDKLGRRPVVMAGLNVDSPLRFSPETLQAILIFARAGQPINITPFILTGILSPATLAGSLAQQNAEILAGITLAQVASPGTPVLYGSFATHADMRAAAPVFGSPEGVLMEVAAGQLASYYRLPHRGMGLVTTSSSSDFRAAMEKMNCLWSLTLSNVHFLLHAAGWLDGGLTASYEQFVLDLEMIESMERFLGGFPVDAEALAVDTIAEVGPGGSYLLAGHTLDHFRGAVRMSPLLEDQPADGDEASISSALLSRANARWREWLREYQEPSLDPAVEEAARDYVNRRKTGEPPKPPAINHT